MSRRLRKIALILIVILVGRNASLMAQLVENQKTSIIFIGELKGRTDNQELLNARFRGLYFLNQAQNIPTYTTVINSDDVLQIRTSNPAPTNNKIPSLFEYRFYDSEWDLISDLILEKIDFARLIYEESAQEIAKSNRAIHILSELLPRHLSTNIMLNCRHPVLKIQDIRQALSYSIDKNAIINKLLKKRADIARGPFDSDYDAYESSLNEYKYNPKRALKLLEKQGWSDQDGDGILEDIYGNSLKFRLIYRKGLLLDEQLIRWIKINWNQIGIDVQPQPLTYSEIRIKLKQSQFDAVLLDSQFEEGISSIANVFTSQGIENFSGYSNKNVDNYVNLYQKIEDKERRRILLRGIQKIVNEEQPVIFLYFKWLIFTFINSNRIENYLNANGNFRKMNEWKIHSGHSVK